MRHKTQKTPLTLQRDPIEPNEDVAAAIVALGSELPDDVSVDLCLLAPDTVRVSYTGHGRTIDVTHELGSEHCDVTLHTFTPGSLGHAGVPDPGATHHRGVAVEELITLLGADR